MQEETEVKKRNLKWYAGLLLVFMIMSFAGCQKSDAPKEKEKGLYTAGTYEETVQGHNGDLTVSVELSKDAIVSVKVLSHKESAGISDTPLERIPEEIVDGQTLAVDTIAGATVTSKAILAAVEACIIKAGGDAEKLKAATDKEEETKVTEITTDVVVVGGGGAGLVAAASAEEHGAKVIVLEKLAATGGSTALSGGGISATDTKFQRAEGIEDSKESWMELWKERQDASNKEGMYPDYDFVDRFMDAAVVTTEWLVDTVKHEYSAIMGFGLDPVRRLHFAKSDATTKGGTTLTNNIKNFITGEGVEIRTETEVVDILVDENGKVIGVEAKDKNGKVIVHADKVILAAGGFAKSEELLERFVPEAKGTSALSWASAGSTGDGIVMAEKLGAALYEEPWVMGVGIGSEIPGTQALGMDWTRLYVNNAGERFMNEEVHYSIATNKLIEEKGTWLLVDSTEANAELVKALEDAIPSEEVVKGETFKELAENMKVSVETLEETMKTFNEGVKSGVDAMGKSKDYLVSVEKAPYYAIKFYPVTMGTFGGVKTNDSFQVLKDDGSIIENLYATGENANKILYNQVYMSGSAVQFALTSGRIAGQHAAENLK